MKHIGRLQFLLCIVLIANLTACAAPVVPAPGVTAAPIAATNYSDPFAYCTAVGTIDTPDARYNGPKVPDGIVSGLKKATGAAADMPVALFQQGSFWRCMNGKVYGCFVGANLPCSAKANVNKTPTTEMTDFCKANASADIIPAAVTGRETVYEWRCRNGAPESVRQVQTPDARGFISSIWYELGPS